MVSGPCSSIFASQLSWLEQKFHRFLPPWISFSLWVKLRDFLERWQTVSFLCVMLREEFTKEIIDSAPKRERREDPESHRGPEKTATKYRRKAGYSPKKPRQTELQRSPQSGDGQWRSPESSWKVWRSTLGANPKLSQTSHPVTDRREVGSSLMNVLLEQRMPSVRLCKSEGSCLVFYYWRLSYLESLRLGNNDRQVAWI